MTNRPLRAVDISFSGVRWVEVATGPHGAELRRWGVLSARRSVEAGGNGSPPLPEPQDLARLFGDTSSRRWKGRPRVLVSLPSSLSTARFLRLPPTGAAQVRSAVEFEVREALEIEGDGLRWDFLSLSEDGGASKETRVLAVATLAERLRPYLECLKEAGFEIQRIVPGGLASFWGLQASLDRENEDHVLLLDIGPMESVLTLGDRREILGSRSVPAGSRYSQETFWREVGQTVEFFRQRFTDAKPGALYLVGEAEPGAPEESLPLAGIAIRRFHPGTGLEALEVSGDLHHEELNRFAAPLGLVAAELGNVAQINLLASREAKARARLGAVGLLRKALRQGWHAVLVVLLVILTWLGGPSVVDSARQSRIDRAEEVAARIQDLGREMGWMKKIASERVNWSELFLGLSDTVPGDINVTEISFNEDGDIRIAGNLHGNLANLSEFIGKLEESEVLKDTRIEKSQSEERKLDFVIRARKGAGNPPEPKEGAPQTAEKPSTAPASEEAPPGKGPSVETPPEPASPPAQAADEPGTEPPQMESAPPEPGKVDVNRPRVEQTGRRPKGRRDSTQFIRGRGGQGGGEMRTVPIEEYMSEKEE